MVVDMGNNNNNSQHMVANKVMVNKWVIHIKDKLLKAMANNKQPMVVNKHMVDNKQRMVVVLLVETHMDNNNKDIIHMVEVQWVVIQVKWDSQVKSKCHITEMFLNHNLMDLLDRKILLKM